MPTLKDEQLTLLSVPQRMPRQNTESSVGKGLPLGTRVSFHSGLTGTVIYSAFIGKPFKLKPEHWLSQEALEEFCAAADSKVVGPKAGRKGDGIPDRNNGVLVRLDKGYWKWASVKACNCEVIE